MASPSTYRLTIKFAPSGVPHFNERTQKWETSTWGHVWLEARKPSESLDAEPSFSRGWSTGDSKFTASDNLSPNDWKNYRSSKGNLISSITVDITKDQFNKIQNYENAVREEKIPGFGKNYHAAWDSCIDFSGKGLGFIGLAGRDFDGSALFWARPDKQVNAFLEQIAEHRRKGAALVVEHRGRSYTFAENERDVKKFWRTIDPYWYLAQDENQREQPYQYAQTDIAKPALRIEDMPQYAQNIYHQGKQVLTDFFDKKGIAYDANSLDNIAMALASVGYPKYMRGVSLVNINNEEIVIGHKAPELRTASVNMKIAANTPIEESLTKIQETAQAFEDEVQQKQIAQSQSRGIMIS
ncbi:TPA: hypothetical protein ACFP3W_000783 [Neisseria subflava]